MANTYYDSELTAEEIEEVLEAINGILTQANNGKVLAISNGKFEARSVQWGGGEPTIESLSVTENGTYTAPSGVDGYSPITVNVSGGGTPSRETIIDPNIMTAIGSYNTNTVSKQYVPLISRTQSGTSSAAEVSRNAVYRIGYFTGGFIFPQKIKAGDYSKIYADVEVTQYGTGWRQCKLYLSSTFALQNSGDGGSIIKTVWLATQDLTSEQINAQAGVIINSTSQYSLSRQVVEIDISSVNTDFYVGFFNCDENIWVYSLYLE